MADIQEIRDDEIDLGELFASLWAYKSVIAIITAGAIFAGGFYALNAEKIYTGSAVFQLEDSNNSGLSLPSEVSGLAALAGLGGVVSEGNVLFDRITGRAFIRDLDATVDLKGDEYFNTYDPNAKDPLWKAVIKTAIGYTTDDLDPEQVIERNIVEAFRENVTVEETENGALSIKVDHTDPMRAAAIANAIMDQVVTLTERDTEAKQGSQLTYLSETLADTLREMDDAQARLKNFAIENSTLSIEALAAGSVALDEVRNQLDRATALRDAANVLLDAIDQGKANAETYTQLRQSYPIIDDVEFRRVLGLSEIMSEFSWPDRQLLGAVAATLADRRDRIEREMARLEAEAIAYANAAEEQAALERDAKVAEASYTVLIEQVKAQSLLAGYRGETAKVFERAVPPLVASKPNRKLVLALAAVLGIFVGSGVALVLSLRKGVVFSKRALRDELQPTTIVSAARLRKLNGKSLRDVRESLGKMKSRGLSEIAIALRDHSKPNALILGGGAKCSARSAALATAVTIAGSGRRVAVVDLSRTGSTNSAEDAEKGPWAELQADDGVVELGFTSGRENIDLLASPKYDEAIKAASDKYDLVLYSSETPTAEMCAAGLADLDPKAILVGRPKATSKALIQKLRSLKLPTILLLE